MDGKFSQEIQLEREAKELKLGVRLTEDNLRDCSVATNTVRIN